MSNLDHSVTDPADGELAALRASIDNLDAAMIHILAERFRCTHRIGLIKAARSMPAMDPEREARQRDRLKAMAGEAGLDPDFAERFFHFVVEEVRSRHRALAVQQEAVARSPADD
jgi:chorismate mutase